MYRLISGLNYIPWWALFRAYPHSIPTVEAVIERHGWHWTGQGWERRPTALLAT